MNKKKPLVADKELFRLWYEFYRLALNSNDKVVQNAVKKSKSFYADWNVDVSEAFDPWWAKHRHLFEQNQFVRVLSDISDKSAGTIVLEIPIHKARTEVLAEIRAILPSVLPARPARNGAKYLPTETRGVKRDSLRIMLDLQRRIFSNELLKGEKLTSRVIKFFEHDRYKRKANRVPASFFIDTYSGITDNVDRNIRRYRQKVQKLILNVANGEFPGKY